jgi:hypothetical protein
MSTPSHEYIKSALSWALFGALMAALFFIVMGHAKAAEPIDRSLCAPTEHVEFTTPAGEVRTDRVQEFTSFLATRGYSTIFEYTPQETMDKVIIDRKKGFIYLSAGGRVCDGVQDTPAKIDELVKMFYGISI